MQRHRTIAGPPQRTATAAWDVTAKLITDTVIVSDEVTAADVADALAPLRGIGPALIAAGHLESTPVVLVSGTLHVSIVVVTGTAAISVEENLNPLPGGSSADRNWMLYIPKPAPMAAVVAAAVDKSAHLSDESAPADERSTESGRSGPGLVDLAALSKLRAST